MSLRRTWRRLVGGGEQVEVEELQEVCRSLGAVPVEDAPERERVAIAGVVRAVTHSPAGSAPRLTGEFSDGTGVVDLVWLGRDAVPGIDPGVRLRAQGRIGVVQGRRTMYNPRYEILPR